MKRLLRAVGAVAALTAAGLASYRFAARRRALPCPAWLTCLLENPYVETVAGSQTLLERAGVGPGMRVLDAGCGPGRVTIPAASRVGPKGEVVALDLQPAMLRRLQERMFEGRVENVRVVQGRLGASTLEPASFDRVLLVTVLGEIPNREGALAEIHDALRPGGVLSVTEVLPDPHYQTLATVRRLAEGVGLRFGRAFGNPLAFTANFVRPTEPDASSTEGVKAAKPADREAPDLGPQGGLT